MSEWGAMLRAVEGLLIKGEGINPQASFWPACFLTTQTTLYVTIHRMDIGASNLPQTFCIVLT